MGEVTVLTITLITLQNETSGGDGYAEVQADGGTAPYNYYWSNGQTGPALQNVPAGSYHVTVEDASGQTAKEKIYISTSDANVYLVDEDGNYIEDDEGNRIITE